MQGGELSIISDVLPIMDMCVCVCVCSVTQSCLIPFDLRTVARLAPLSTGFSQQEYWSGLPFSPPGDLSDSGMEPQSTASPALQANSLTQSR